MALKKHCESGVGRAYLDEWEPVRLTYVAFRHGEVM